MVAQATAQGGEF